LERSKRRRHKKLLFFKEKVREKKSEQKRDWQSRTRLLTHSLTLLPFSHFASFNTQHWDEQTLWDEQ
jgi:hypothetical protein